MAIHKRFEPVEHHYRVADNPEPTPAYKQAKGGRHPEPGLSYNRAMRMYCGWRVDGGTEKLGTIYECPTEEFMRLLRRAIKLAANPEKVWSTLSPLHVRDCEHFVVRWWVMETLLELGVQPFWAETYVSIQQAERTADSGQSTDR